MTEAQYTPPLGTGDTADYDRAIRRWTREMRWRGAMLELLAARAGETILDIGCGTGSFAVMLKAASPDAVVIGIDPDAEALSIARDKAQSASVSIEWRQGFARDLEAAAADAVVSSLMRFLFRQTIQRLDGVEDTQPNADGMLPGLMAEAGFDDVREARHVHTATGTITLFLARRR